MAGVATSRRRSPWAPYLMILQALVYLGVFLVVPFWSLFGDGTLRAPSIQPLIRLRGP